MDMNMTEFQKLGPNVTGFELINRSDPAVVKINQDWLDFDSKDLKLARRSLRVSPDQPQHPSHTLTDTRLVPKYVLHQILSSKVKDIFTDFQRFSLCIHIDYKVNPLHR